MIYNFKEYLKALYPSKNYAVNGAHETSPNELIILNETTAPQADNIDRIDYTVQIFSRAKSPLVAKEQIQDIFDKVNKYYDVMLPESVEVLGDGSTTTFPEVKAYQMIPIQSPVWFGYDKNGLALYVFNLKITTR